MDRVERRHSISKSSRQGDQKCLGANESRRDWCDTRIVVAKGTCRLFPYTKSSLLTVNGEKLVLGLYFVRITTYLYRPPDAGPAPSASRNISSAPTPGRTAPNSWHSAATRAASNWSPHSSGTPYHFKAPFCSVAANVSKQQSKMRLHARNTRSNSGSSRSGSRASLAVQTKAIW